MKVYLVTPGWEDENYTKPNTRHVFTNKKDAQQFYINTFVKPFFNKTPKKKIAEYFDFDPFKPNLSAAQFKDILFTFNQNGEIYHIDMD